MNPNITYEQIEKMSLFELRYQAKRMMIADYANFSFVELQEVIKHKIDSEQLEINNQQQVDVAVKRGRGRPRKNPNLVSEEPKLRKKSKVKVEDLFVDKKPAGTKENVLNDIPLTVNMINQLEEELEAQPEALELIDASSLIKGEGVLEILPDGFGFLRASNYYQGDGDAYISTSKIKLAGLRKGDYITAKCRRAVLNRPSAVHLITSINGLTTDSLFTRPNFETLTPIHPEQRYQLEIANAKNDFAIRAIDLVAPIGKGQRGMIVSPPKAGKTTLLKKIAQSISTNYPKVKLIVLLIDERPEEVTDMQRSIDGEVIYSTFDEMPEHHTKCVELVIERAKRLVELGSDVVILMDSLTRLARAYNLVIPPTGRLLSGGIDPGALYNPKKFFGAARKIEDGGSLTILATALIDTGSRMDDVVYEEFKGTGNMEIHLDRKLSEKRIFPAIDLNRSGTRREDLLLDTKEIEGMWAIRKLLSNGDMQESTENLINMMMQTSCNRDFILQLSAQMNKLAKSGFVFRKTN